MDEMNRRRSKVLKLNVDKDSPSKAQGGAEQCNHHCHQHEEEVKEPTKKLSGASTGVFGAESGVIGEVLEERIHSRV